MTLPECLLWQCSRTRPDGLKFRKQHPAEPYTLDFFCHEAAVAIEVDGMAHDMGSNPNRDLRRDAWLASQGVKTIRFMASDVLSNMDGVLETILQACIERCPSTALRAVPLPGKGRGGI